MDNPKIAAYSVKLFAAIEALIPEFCKNQVDFGVNNGNLAVFLIGPNGEIFGQTFGKDMPKCRDTSITAWKKASQVWLTRVATGEYERKVFNGEVEWWNYGVMKSDLIGWNGGIPAVMDDGTEIALGFSGFRGETDVELLEAALKVAGGKRA
jgi:hypothetical protein